MKIKEQRACDMCYVKSVDTEVKGLSSNNFQSF